MAQAFKCDRCGCFFEDYTPERHRIDYRLKLLNRSFGDDRDGDLCVNCQNALNDFMNYKPTFERKE